MSEEAVQSVKTQDNEEGVTAEQAMNVVLDAERKAREAVDQCKAQADSLLQKARQKSQRIGQRVDDRITRMHQRISRVMTDEVKKLDEEQQQLAKQEYLYHIDNDVTKTVVNQIAELLTTPDETDSIGDDSKSG